MTQHYPLTPIIVLTGFLGSGKTTLLNKLLKSPALARTAVVINEFGEIGIDHQLVETIDDSTVILESGCVCCTIREDLKTAILALHDQRARGVVQSFERIVLETTGLAEPGPILHTLINDPQLRLHYRVASVVTTVDAMNVLSQLANFEEAVQQVASADRLVLTKTDCVSPAQECAVRAMLTSLNRAPVVSNTEAAGRQKDTLLGGAVLDPTARGRDVASWLTPEPPHGHTNPRHAADIYTFCLVHAAPFDWTAFGIWLTLLLHAHGKSILRVKGLLNVAGVATPVVINGVQHVVHPPFHLDRWPDEDHRSRIVFIVRGIPRAAIETSFSVFNQMI